MTCVIAGSRMPKACGPARIGNRDAPPPARRAHVLFNTTTCSNIAHGVGAAVPAGISLHYFLQEPPRFSRRGGKGTTKEDSNQTNPKTRDSLITPRPNETPKIVSNSTTWMFDETARSQFFI